ncbi:hypothetical protein K439DRAFT_1346870 [Ramaria rubella]|nr:hypothetical protein K439DRAFT_1346870 [Ramaria rubella]
MDVTGTDPLRDWSYLSEGGATIVFSYVGLDSTYNGTVLRLRKLPRQNAVLSHLTTLSNIDVQEEAKDDPSIAFQDVISNLIPRKHLPRLQTVKLSSPWLEALESVTDVHRPPERRANDGIDTFKRKGVLATDLVGGNGWTVEIKPKWGFLPSSEHLSPTTRLLKTRHCRFCMHTYFRGTVETSYCPLDLFSNDEARVRGALRSLWEAWVANGGKENNLRVFNKGKIVSPEDSSALPINLVPQFVDAISPLIMNSSLFSILGDLQRTLDSLDIEGLSHLWSRSHPNIPLGREEPEPTLAEWSDLIQTYLLGGEAALRYYTLSYLLSATFKDCSVMLRLQNADDMAGNAEDTISVIDLDPKSIHRLAKWEALDREIVKKFAEVADQRKTCVDAQRQPPSDDGPMP